MKLQFVELNPTMIALQVWKNSNLPSISIIFYFPFPVDKKLRASTLQKSVMSEKFREAAKRQRDKRRPYTKPEGYRITQAEMLAEAKETEKINLNSLGE